MPEKSHRRRRGSKSKPTTATKPLTTNLSLELPPSLVRNLIVDALDSGRTEYWDELEGTGWQADKEVVLAAVQAGLVVDTPLWRQDKEFVKKIFNWYGVSTDLYKHIWKKMPAEYRRDPEIAFAALRHNCTNFRGLPKAVKRKKQVIKALEEKLILWKELPTSYKEDGDYFVSAPANGSIGEAMRVIKKSSSYWSGCLESVDGFPITTGHLDTYRSIQPPTKKRCSA